MCKCVSQRNHFQVKDVSNPKFYLKNIPFLLFSVLKLVDFVSIPEKQVESKEFCTWKNRKRI